MSKYDAPNAPPPGYPQQPPAAHYDAGPANADYYNSGPPQQYGGQPQYGQPGPPQQYGGQPQYGQQPMMYQQQQYPTQQGQYYGGPPPDNRGGKGGMGAGGCFAGLCAGLAACCCLDMLF
ncbi:hypothetical protein TI39_contig282g00012 [Zymoseptoria brevis]|uniref:Cysteine-rich transmembrane CYSTM domain-containing protein n=1 Tax=Zymoseptoria brevis TaxID=1047168 RepID=A0A0F4GWB2_9PEZI|nr:hypothetical protein TI39_contig282g00012 [Zymoseptoria brevis]